MCAPRVVLHAPGKVRWAEKCALQCWRGKRVVEQDVQMFQGSHAWVLDRKPCQNGIYESTREQKEELFKQQTQGHHQQQHLSYRSSSSSSPSTYVCDRSNKV